MESSIQKIIAFRNKRKWKQFHSPKNLAISLVLEAAEVLEIFQWTKNNKLPIKRKNELTNELADVYYWLLLLSHDLGINLDNALNEKMKENEKKYPLDKARNKSTKYNKL